MKKEYNTPSMIITSFESEGVIMASGIKVATNPTIQNTSIFGELDFNNFNK